MTQLIVAIVIILINVGIGALAKRQKDLAKKQREEERRRESARAGTATVDTSAPKEESLLDILMRETGARPEAPPSEPVQIPPSSAPAPPTTSPAGSPTGSPLGATARRTIPKPTVRAPMPVDAPGPSRTRSEPKRRPTQSGAKKPPRPADRTNGSKSAAGRKAESSSRSPTRIGSRPESEGARRRRLDHDERVRERAERKLARQEWSRSRKARTTTRVSKLYKSDTLAKAVKAADRRKATLHPIAAALRDVFRNAASIKTAFIAGEILQGPTQRPSER